MQRVILHCDMNNFYASVECMLNPELKNKPVAVCGSVEERHGIVLAKNYAAKAFGVSTGEAIWQAKQRCQDLVIVEPHYEQYMKFSKLAREIYGRYTDQIEPYGMDECWLDVTGSGCMGTGFEIADEIRRTVKFELGLTISAGVSFNKIFAKLGSDMKKPDAITCIEADSFREKIWCLPASDLLGVGRATEKVLSGYGIHTIGELAATSDDFLKCRLGKNGLAIKKYANGLDDSPVMRSDYVSPVKSIGHGITTMQDLENKAEVWCVMLELVQGEGGVVALDADYVAKVAAFCREKDILLIVDEVQTGVGRTGRFLACEHFGLKPDIVTLAKGLGGGLPIGAVVMNQKVAAHMGPGSHGSTFGGNPVCCAGALAVLDTMDEAFLAQVRERAAQLRAGLAALPHVQQVSGLGLMVGIELADGIKAAEVRAACEREGLLVLTAKTRLRLLPPLILTADDVAAALATLRRVLENTRS